MGWRIHSTLTGAIQSGMPINQAAIILSKTSLDQPLEEEEEKARGRGSSPLDNLEGKHEYGSVATSKLSSFCVYCLQASCFSLVTEVVFGDVCFG